MDVAIRYVVANAVKNLEDIGYNKNNAGSFKRIYTQLIGFCEKEGIEHYSIDVGEQFTEFYEGSEPPFSKAQLCVCRMAMKRLNCVFLEKEWVRDNGGRKPKPYENSCHNGIRDTYEKYLYSKGNEKKDIRIRIHAVSRFLKNIEDQGIIDFSVTSGENIYSAFVNLPGKTRFRTNIGHFLTYAYKRGLLKNDLYCYLPKMNRHKPIPSVYTSEEIAQIIESIDRRHPSGKRAYAIVIIGARLGLRASDIAGLTFDSLVESSGIIRLKAQQKTKNPLKLPLLPEVKDAITDYVKNARPASEDTHIFLNVVNANPITPANIGKIVELTIKSSGVDQKNRRTGSHVLRSSLASSLISEGIAYPVVQQVLGQQDIRSTKAYVKIDVEQLRTYAMDVPPATSYLKNMLEQGVHI